MQNPLLIPILGIVFGCSIPIIVVYLDYKKKQSIFELHHRERMAAIDKGMEVPPLPAELLDGPSSSKPAYPPSHLLRGLVWSAVGIGMFLALRSITDEDEAMLGAIPFAIGIAYLVYYAIEGRHVRAKLMEKMLESETSTPPRV